MLSKRLSDIIFIGVTLIIIGVIIGARVIIINQYDARIDGIEADQERLQQQITAVSRLVDDNRNDQLPSLIEMYQRVPSEFNGPQLRDYLIGMMTLSGIEGKEGYSRQLTVSAEPVTFPQDSDFRRVSENLDPYRITMILDVDSLDNLADFLHILDDSQQLFLVQTLVYDLPEDPSEPIRVTLYVITFYEQAPS